MPFTPTHVLAILPIAAIKRWRLPFSALVIGSMIPDFPLFVPLSPDYSTTHSPLGVLTACLPIGLACFYVLRIVMTRPLLAILPAPIQRRCWPHAARRVEPGLTFFARASLGVVVGAWTHLFWDSFTHRGRWGTQLFPGLNETALTIGGHAVPGFKLLQYGSTLFGLPLLMLSLATWLSRQTPGPVEGRPLQPRWTKAVVSFLIVAVPAAVALFVWRGEELAPYDRLGQAITAAGLALIAVTLTYCVAFLAAERWLGPPRS